MRTTLLVLTFLMLASPLAATAQGEEDAPRSTESAETREALREELAAARRDVAQAARKLARLQRELSDVDVEALRFERLRALEELEQLEGIEGLGRRMDGMERRIHREVIRGLRMTRPRLGVLLGSDGDANEIVGVTPGSGAERAGIETGDRLVAINGQSVDAADPESLGAPMEDAEPGDTVPVEIERDGERMTLDVSVSSPIAELPLTHWIEREREFVDGRPVDRIIMAHRGHLMRPKLGVLLDSEEGKGDVVAGLTPGSGAEAAGIQPGDRLLAIAGEAVDSEDPESFSRPLEGVREGESVPVEIERDVERMTFEVEVSSAAPGKRYFERRFQRGDEEKSEIMIIDPDGFSKPSHPRHISPRLLRLVPQSDMISNHAGLEPYFGTAEGVVVLRIDADNLLQLQDGDVVLSIDGERMSRPVDIGRELVVRAGDTITLEVMRGGERITFDTELPEGRAASRGL